MLPPNDTVVTPKYIPFKCPVCNGFGTLKYGEIICHACDGKGFVLVDQEREKENGHKNNPH